MQGTRHAPGARLAEYPCRGSWGRRPLFTATIYEPFELFKPTFDFVPHRKNTRSNCLVHATSSSICKRHLSDRMTLYSASLLSARRVQHRLRLVQAVLNQQRRPFYLEQIAHPHHLQQVLSQGCRPQYPANEPGSKRTAERNAESYWCRPQEQKPLSNTFAKSTSNQLLPSGQKSTLKNLT